MIILFVKIEQGTKVIPQITDMTLKKTSENVMTLGRGLCNNLELL